MGSTCSQCAKNKEGDMEFGSNLSCYCDLHGSHGMTTQACSDFSPSSSTPSSLDRSLEEIRYVAGKFVIKQRAKPKEQPRHESSDLSMMMLPVITFVIATVAILIIGTFAMTNIGTQTLAMLGSSSAAVWQILPIMLMVALLFAFAYVAKPVS